MDPRVILRVDVGFYMGRILWALFDSLYGIHVLLDTVVWFLEARGLGPQNWNLFGCSGDLVRPSNRPYGLFVAHDGGS